MSDDRKYRQRGYQDTSREPRGPSQGQKRPVEARDPRLPRDPKVPNLPGFREVFRCSRCGNIESPEVMSLSKCGKCGVDLHACIQCDSFDPGATFECRQVIRARVSPKDAANDCPLFAPRHTVERETGSTPAASSPANSSRKAFDDLFKF
jgi:hypothetical protein